MKVAASVFATLSALIMFTNECWAFFSRLTFLWNPWRFFIFTIICIAVVMGSESLWYIPKFAGWLLLGCALILLMMFGFEFYNRINIGRYYPLIALSLCKIIMIVLIGVSGVFSLIAASTENKKIGLPTSQKPLPLDPSTGH